MAELARYFLDQAAALGLPRKTLNPDAVNRLMAHPWPGNVRELENLMRRLAALSREEAITAGAVEHGLLEGVEDKESSSEEHTSELQSLMRISYAVYCMKQKKQR